MGPGREQRRWQGRALAVALAAATAPGPGCEAWDRGAGTGGAPPAANAVSGLELSRLHGARPPIVLVSIDTLRFDRMTPQWMPALSAFAQESVHFDDATSPAPWTLPAHMSVWTARWPGGHGLTNRLALTAEGAEGDAVLPAEIPTFPETLVAAGYTAHGFTGGSGVRGVYGFARGFSTWDDAADFAGLERSVPAALAWLATAKSAEPFLLFVHGYDVHGQHPFSGDPRSALPSYAGAFDASVAENEKLREDSMRAIRKPGDPPSLVGTVTGADAAFLAAVYDRKAAAADAQFAELLAGLRASGLYERAVVAMISDHGEEFMEHGTLDHGALLCQHQLHVPMLVHFPGQTAGIPISTPVSTLDLFPTVLDAVGIAAPSGADGESLMPLIRGEKRDVSVYAETDYRLFVHLRALRRGAKKVMVDLQDGESFVYALDSDSAESAPLADKRTSYELTQGVYAIMGELGQKPASYASHDAPARQRY